MCWHLRGRNLSPRAFGSGERWYSKLMHGSRAVNAHTIPALFPVFIVSNAALSSSCPTYERVKTGDFVSLARRPTKARSFVAPCPPHLGEVSVKPARSAPPQAAEGA
jgi:hypothetical protein